MPNGQRLFEGEPQTLEGSDVPQSADVLIVVSMASCNTEVIPKLQDLVNRLDAALIIKGMDNNMYGLVGYGGQSAYSYPHSHTMDGQLLASKTRYTQVIHRYFIDAAVYSSSIYNNKPGVEVTDKSNTFSDFGFLVG